MDKDQFKFSKSIKCLMERIGKSDDTLNKCLRLCHISPINMDKILDLLSAKVLDPLWTENMKDILSEHLLVIVSKAFPLEQTVDQEDIHQLNCVALSKLVDFSPAISKYSLKYFCSKPAPFAQFNKKSKQPKSDREKTSDLNVVKCCYRFLKNDLNFYKNMWKWSEFLEIYSNSGCDVQRIYCNCILALITNMTEKQLKELNQNIPEDIQIKVELECLNLEKNSTNNLHIKDELDELLHSSDWNYSSKVVTNIEGVALPIFDIDNCHYFEKSDDKYENIVKVNSTKTNLRSLALGISAGRAICLAGPVGCGKTTLVEYLARKTGRIAPKLNKISMNSDDNNVISKEEPNKVGNKLQKRKVDNLKCLTEDEMPKGGFLRIQLGDQTDSKMLLGQYRCTDVPGEFVWQPGVLTQAVMNGFWLLLEDLDSAAQDVITVLINLLENKYLSVPGFRDCLRISPGFQLFVTLRNQKTINHSQQSTFQLIEKYLYIVNILPLSRNELCEVISENYPKLSTISGRIVDVYLGFSSGCHDEDDDKPFRDIKTSNEVGSNTNEIEKISTAGLSNSNRLISTRDLLKLCRRSDSTFSVTSAECAYFVFQNAVDVFCSYLPQSPIKTQLIINVGAKLGIIKSRCEYLSIDYKPEVSINEKVIKIGRTILYREDEIGKKRRSNTFNENTQKKMKTSDTTYMNVFQEISVKAPTFSFTRLAACILERISVSVTQNEPILLVGETGVGKTSSVQYLSYQMHRKLVVVNMNNQSDVSDLVGGFKPVDMAFVINPLRTEFEFLFKNTFNASKNEKFLNNFSVQYNQGNFSVLVQVMLKIVQNVFNRKENDLDNQGNEIEFKSLLNKWKNLETKLLKLNSQLKNSINLSFSFISGSLVNCIKNGDWVLLDEINLASSETLECLSTILEPDGSIVLLERGDFAPIERHPNFRIFACMNPNTDIGKKDLPVGIRNRFTEFFVDELTSENDLMILINDYLSKTGIKKAKVVDIAKLYTSLRALANLDLNDGLGQRPVYSLRTLCRALTICAKNLCGSIERNLYESFCLSFLTQLDPYSHDIVLKMIQKALLSNAKAILGQEIPKPAGKQLFFEGYWVEQGRNQPMECKDYILTESVRQNLKDLARIISIGKLPILLQGPTSAGKTSLIEYVAKRSGNHCLRINNHEHTDLQEYIGTYAADVNGKLSFKEGVLVQAMKNGNWIILDELNLAPSDILEALNRVLDDNRELFITETQTLIKAHPNFMLFATQNPPGLYGGRKTLSRAFKNRFIELHFSEIPRPELEIILEQRCLVPKSYAQKMVKTMSELQINRKSTAKSSFTLRDLFRWGNRYTFADKSLLNDKSYDWNQHLVEEGYLVLSAKIRNNYEVDIIETTLFNNFRKKIDVNNLFTLSDKTSMVSRCILDQIEQHPNYKNIVWTFNMKRMAVLTAKALQFDEPVLLVGPTGCGKTTICQILADISKKTLRILNCHMHTEAADFLGGLRPYRGSTDEQSAEKQKRLFEWANGPLIYSMQEGTYFLADEISLAEDSVLERLNCILEPDRTVLLAEKGGLDESLLTNSRASDFVVKARSGFQFLATMNPGGDFGKKELSPALRNRFTEIWCRPTDTREDLWKVARNSLMAKSTYQNRPESVDNIATILIETIYFLKSNVEKFNYSIRDILAWIEYITLNGLSESNIFTITEAIIFGLETIFLDSLEMQSTIGSLDEIEKNRYNILEFVTKLIRSLFKDQITLKEVKSKKGTMVITKDDNFGIAPFFIPVNQSQVLPSVDFLFSAPSTQENLFRLLSALSLNKAILLEGPPGVGKTSLVENLTKAIGFNVVRINLCEHTDLADLFGTDLPTEDTEFLSDDNTNSNPALGSFQWRDGPLLAALKAPNTWILLDELNLAPQSVLEGLNAILDHRGEVYIPELNRLFKLQKQTRIFASQNPLKQGGGRKGLPQSFLNRFTKVYLRKLNTKDLLHVTQNRFNWFFESLKKYFYIETDELKTKSFFDEQHTQGRFDLAEKMVEFSECLDHAIADFQFGCKGGPYEVNLRDILRWCEFLSNATTGFSFNEKLDEKKRFSNFLLVLFEKMKLVYYQRMRSDVDRFFIKKAFSRIFVCDADHLEEISQDNSVYWTDNMIYIDDIRIEKNNQNENGQFTIKDDEPLLLKSQRETLKNLAECVLMAKPVILCGSSDNGKTKTVDLLCSLLNTRCNVDTIDDSVTGGFQQIDLNRHLEEISESVEHILRCRLQRLALVSEIKAICHLLVQWERYNDVAENVTKTNTVSEQLLLFRQRIGYLNSVVDELIKNPASNNIKEYLQQVKLQISALKKIINKTETLNTGGHFEWVDSKIVKSIKYGQFICLEHVNLCSSAILDRLNPVFEPNGTLLMSEKGVSSNDESEIIKQHRNFRAFLTLDPRNGEISRAMRNRCIELSLNKEPYTENDLCQMIYNAGVQRFYMINCLLRIHHRLKDVSEFSNFGISHLMKSAFLIAENQRIGCSDIDSLYKSTFEVYVRSSNTDLLGFGLGFYRNKLKTEIVDELKSLKQGKNIGEYKNTILKANHLNQLSMIRLQAEPFFVVFKCFVNGQVNCNRNLSNLFKEFSNVEFEMSEHFLRYLLYIFYEVCSYNDIEVRRIYIQNELEKISNLNDINKNVCERLTNLNKIFSTQLLNSNEIKHGPHSDLPWNNYIFSRIRDYSTGTLDLNVILKNSLQLIVKFIFEDLSIQDTKKLNQINAISYSKAVHSKMISDSLNNTLINSLYPMMESFKKNIESTLMSASNLEFEDYVNIVCAILWNNRFLKICQQKLFEGKKLNEKTIDNVKLHFKWMYKHLLKTLPDQYEITTNSKHLQKIKKFILLTEHPLNMFRKVYGKTFTNFLAYFDEFQIVQFHLINIYENLSRLMPTFGEFEKDELKKRLNLMMNPKSNELKMKLSSIVSEELYRTKLLSEDVFVDSISELNDLSILKSELDKLKEMNLEMSVVVIKSLQLQIEMLPLLEYFAMKGLKNTIEATRHTGKYRLNYTFFESINSMGINELQLLNTIDSECYQICNEKWDKIINEIECDYKHAMTLNVKRIIEDDGNYYKNFSTVRSNVLRKMRTFSLDSICVNSSICFEDPDIQVVLPTSGAILTNAALSVLLSKNGDLRSGALGELDVWRHSLKTIANCVWSNVELFQNDFNFEKSDLLSCKQYATKLIVELEYLRERWDKSYNENIEFYEDFQNLMKELKFKTANCYLSERIYGDCMTNESKDLSMKHVAVLYSIIGSIELNLLPFMPLIDPIEKNHLKKQYIEEDMIHLESLLTAYDFMKITMSYKNLGEEILTYFRLKFEQLDIRKSKFSKKVALRPKICIYKKLFDDVTHFLKSCCHPKSLFELIKLSEVCLAQDIEVNTNQDEAKQYINRMNELIKRIELWISNSKRFQYHTLTKYLSFYRDFLDPIENSISMLIYGFKGLQYCLIKQRDRIVNVNNMLLNLNANQCLNKLLENLIQYPSINGINVLPVTENSHNNILMVLEKLDLHIPIRLLLMKSKLREICNDIAIASNLNDELRISFESILMIFNVMWKKQEDMRRKKMIEDESLYVNKSRCETEDEEETIAMEIQNMFPNYVEEDFGEFIQASTLEQVTKNKTTKSRPIAADILNQDDFHFICTKFLEIFDKFSKSYYHKPIVDGDLRDNLEIIEPFKMKVKVFHNLFKEYRTCLNSRIDSIALNSIGLLTAVAQEDCYLTKLNENKTTTYNFYKDSNVPEILHTIDLLNRLDSRVKKELEQWPDHAVLDDIIRIIDRIRSLPSTSSVVRFSSGFQILRQKVDEWNMVAHKNNNFKDIEVELAGFIQRWTKLELQCWRESLTQSFKNVQSKAYKYWFFIYNLIHEYLNKSTTTFCKLTNFKNVEKYYDENDPLVEEIDENCSTLKSSEIVEVLMQFIESSSFAEYSVRMSIIKGFEQYIHLIKIGTEKRKNTLIQILHNLHLYFDQFRGEIEERIKSIRTPIEKKLKEFVKIESYNKDLSYFSMRNNIARVHRNLHKFLKEFEIQIGNRISSIFTLKANSIGWSNFDNDKGKNLRFEAKVKYYMVKSDNFLASERLIEQYQIPKNVPLTSLKYLPRVKSLFSTSRNISKKAIMYSMYPDRIYAIDLLLRDQIETGQYLSQLEVDRTKEKDKQKIQAKQILTQKRKALADLFKTLTMLGVSFKAGVRESLLTKEMFDFKIAPFCIRTMIFDAKQKKTDQNIINLSDKLNLYFANCIYKLKLLQTVLLTPNAELGMPNLERLKGFSTDMFLMVQHQRMDLSETVRNLSELKISIQNIVDLNESISVEDIDVDSFLYLTCNLDSIKAKLCKIYNTFIQYDILLKCPPTESNLTSCVLKNVEPFTKTSKLFSRTKQLSDLIIKLTKNTLEEIDLHRNVFFQNPKKMSEIEKKFNEIVALITTLSEEHLLPSDEHLVIGNGVKDLLIDIQHSQSNTDDEVRIEMDPNLQQNIVNEIENIIHSICLSIETIYKQINEQNLNDSVESKKSNGKNGNNDEDIVPQIEDNHLKEKINDQLRKDFDILNIKKIISKLSDILLVILHSRNVKEVLPLIGKVIGILPLLEQFHNLGKFYLTQQIAATKVSTKMLSILLSVFIELGSKGFCVPPDLMQDDEGDKKNEEQKGGEGFGLEDGTGENDVSDKIESEDQLDTAKKPGDDNKSDDKEDASCKEEKGIDMSEDFDSKLQDVEKRPEDSDNSDDSENEEDLDKQMGETEDGAEKLDDQIWGSDEEENEEEEENEMNDEEGKGSKDETEAHNELDKKNETKDGQQEEDGLDATDAGDEKKQKEKDIDHLDEPEVGDDQVNPYHNELENPPEPEDMDLGDVKLDEENEKDNEENEENPFDIDKMKEKNEPMETDEQNENGEETEETDEKNDANNEVDSDSDEESKTENLKTDSNDEDNPVDEEQKEDEESKKEENKTDQKGEESDENNEEENQAKNDQEKNEFQPSKDKPSKEENVQAMPDDQNKGSTDQIQQDPTENDTKRKEELDAQDTGEDKDGVGQAENEESKSGHQGVADSKETKSHENERKNDKQEDRKLGNADEERTIANADQQQKKQLKTTERMNEEKRNDKDEEMSVDGEEDEYQHVKEAKKMDKTTIDNATEDQAKQTIHKDEIENEENIENEDINEEQMEVDEEEKQNEELTNVDELQSEEMEQKSSKKPSKQDKNKEKCETMEHIEVEGDYIDTATVDRGADTSAHCAVEILQDVSLPTEPSAIDNLEMRTLIEKEMTANKMIQPEHGDFDLWQTISNKMMTSARELCEQLRLILEPTKCTRLKGDYRTGRRINMKKIIPYIASQFRKDKIWLRRTKPAQRDYKITIAIDDSKSMHHNNSKNLTLQAISLVSQALTLLESGRLSIVSFGESPQIILKHSDQFDGPKLVKSLNFAQNQSRIAELLDFVRALNAENMGGSSDNGIFENLLLVLSDGRNIFSEGEQKVKNSVKLARLQRMFIVYIIIDNPENKHSILDIRVPSFSGDRKSLAMKSYLDTFPFPYYVIVRDLMQLPLVLSDAMRQWFELVNSEQ